MLKTSLVLVLICLFFSCNKETKNTSDKMMVSQWLIGSWECKTEDGVFLENWSKVNDSTFSGQSIFLKGKDTIHNESVVLQQVGENLNYKTLIKGQNNNTPIALVLNKTIEDTLQFENFSNDYPQKISYKSITAKQFKVEISGLVQGKLHSENYLMNKVKK